MVVVFEELFASLFKKTTTVYKPLLVPEHLKNPSLVEIRNYFNKYYVPNNGNHIVLVILIG
jgi:predicted Zn-dependent peptidase